MKRIFILGICSALTSVFFLSSQQQLKSLNKWSKWGRKNSFIFAFPSLSIFVNHFELLISTIPLFQSHKINFYLKSRFILIHHWALTDYWIYKYSKVKNICFILESKSQWFGWKLHKATHFIIHIGRHSSKFCTEHRRKKMYFFFLFVPQCETVSLKLLE